MLDLWRRECLGKSIGNHNICWAVDKSYFAVVNDPVDEVKVDVDVLGVGMVLVVFGEHDHRLIVGKESGGGVEWEGSEHMTDH